MKKIYRQGDLYFCEVSRIPEGVGRQNKNLLTYSEVSGNAHVIKGGDVYPMTNAWYVDNRRGVAVLEHGRYSTEVDALIEHVGHRALKIKEKIIKIWRQVEHFPKGFVSKITD